MLLSLLIIIKSLFLTLWIGTKAREKHRHTHHTPDLTQTNLSNRRHYRNFLDGIYSDTKCECVHLACLTWKWKIKRKWSESIQCVQRSKSENKRSTIDSQNKFRWYLIIFLLLLIETTGYLQSIYSRVISTLFIYYYYVFFLNIINHQNIFVYIFFLHLVQKEIPQQRCLKTTIFKVQPPN